LDTGENPRRQSILGAAFEVLMERGYAGASTLEIARRAKVSKRELYAEFGSKTGILEALIAMTSARMQVPLTAIEVTDRKSFVAALSGYGTAALTELTSPYVVAVNRLAAAEAGRSPELGKLLDRRGRDSNRRALMALMAKAQAAGVLGTGDPGIPAGQFFYLLTSDLLLRLVIGVAKAPSAQEIRRRVDAAVDAVLRLHAPAEDR
jgi:AcrR family transcriptional regulator